MNESTSINNSINSNSFFGLSNSGGLLPKNIAQSYSSSQLIANYRLGARPKNSNAHNESTNLNNNSTINDYFSLHTSKLSSSISLINRQMSNMQINKKNVLNLPTKNLGISKNFFEIINSSPFNNDIDSDRDLLQENLKLKAEIEELKEKIKNDKFSKKKERKQDENDIIFGLAQDINNLKEEISKNDFRYKEIKMEYDKIFQENLNLKMSIKDLQKEILRYQSTSHVFNVNNEIINNASFEYINEKNSQNVKNNIYERCINNTYYNTNENNINETSYNHYYNNTNASRNISFLAENIDTCSKDYIPNNFRYKSNTGSIPLYSKKKISSKQNGKNTNSFNFTTIRKQKKLANTVLAELNNKNYDNYPIIEKRVSLSQKKFTVQHKTEELPNFTVSQKKTGQTIEHTHNIVSNGLGEIIGELANQKEDSIYDLPQQIPNQSINNQTNLNNITPNTTNTTLEYKLNLSPIVTTLYKLLFSKKIVISFDLKAHKFISSSYTVIPSLDDNDYDFNSTYQEEGSLFLSTSNYLYILTGPSYNLFYYYSQLTSSISPLSGLSNSHKDGLLIPYNSENIICISGTTSSSVEQYSIENNVWKDLPSLSTPRSESSCLLYNKNYLYVYFGYDYVNKNYLDTIEFLYLPYPSKWESVKVDLEIRCHAAFLPTGTKEEDTSIFIVGGCLDDNRPNNDLIEIRMKGQEFEVIRNTQKTKKRNQNGTPKKTNENMFCFRECFGDYLDVENSGWKKCGYDDKGDVHIIDVTTMKHKIFNCKEK